MTGEPLFLWFFDIADNMAIVDGRIQFGKTADFCQKFSFAKWFRVSLNCLQNL